MIDIKDIQNLQIYLANTLIDSEQINHEYYKIPVVKYSDLIRLFDERKEDANG